MLAAVAAPLHARTPNFKKYPLRINILASRSNSHIPLIILPSVTMPDEGGGGGGFTADDGAGLGPAPVINLPLYEHPDPVFYGTGRADLFAAGLPRGVNFIYDNCRGQVGVTMPHQPFLARWKKTGRILEILVPVATRPNRPQKWDKCQLNVAMQNFVYLLLHNGAMVRVTQDGFASKPALREFTEGLASVAAMQPPTAAPTLPKSPVLPPVLIHTQ
jgi:hypothetical protein